MLARRPGEDIFVIVEQGYQLVFLFIGQIRTILMIHAQSQILGLPQQVAQVFVGISSYICEPDQWVPSRWLQQPPSRMNLRG